MDLFINHSQERLHKKFGIHEHTGVRKNVCILLSMCISITNANLEMVKYKSYAMHGLLQLYMEFIVAHA